MRRVTLRQLQTFEAVARLLSITRAAEEMCVSQPTVSKQIKLLQEEIGLPLIEIIGKKLYLTEAGQELQKTCIDWISSWEFFEQKIANIKGLKQGKLKISTVTTVKYFLPKILGMFCQEYPGIDVSLEVLNRNRVLERLQHNQDDIYIMGVPPDTEDVSAEPFIKNTLVIIAPSGHPLAQQKNIPVSALENEPFILREQGSGTRLLVEKLFNELNLQLNVRMELGSNEAIKQAVAGGMGLSLLSKSSVNIDANQNELCILDVEGFPIKRHWYIVRLQDKEVSVLAQTFIDYLLEHVDLLDAKM
ncbi:LysR family transcriptional regulator [Thiomicrorhabdus sediminis]|uniref:LysR family transcriptional regulator n=1 Tax=Thiomicrorhabdus sediminis TaxID=2580412 RepID=A0A4P9K987_9GAMM|nr:LysR family transcriptional regulator [Thiomicrorhabdus sediminis]QCU90887.1 LysR family transcriptional regulator [Thiomicrorhabdus sediminis]